jgi:hypothetical protein
MVKDCLCLKKDVVLNAASCRVALVSDLEVVGDTEINIQTIKYLAGGDQIHGVKLSTTVLCSMNTLPVYKAVNTYVKPCRIRRIVVIPSVSNRQGTDIDTTLPVYPDSLK